MTSPQEIELLAGLKPRERRRVEAIECLLTACFVEWDGTVTEFVRAYNEGSIRIPDELAEHVPSVSRASLFRWNNQRQAGGRASLVAKWGQRGAGGRRTYWETRPELEDHIYRLLLKHGADVAPSLVRRQLEAAGLQDLPSVQTIRRYLKRWVETNPQLADRITDPNGWKGRHKVAVGRADAGVSTLAGVWEIDSTPADVLLRFLHVSGEERVQRFTLIAVVEVYSRMAYVDVVPSESAKSVLGVLRRVIVEWGRLPDVIRTDQGAAYTSAQFRHVLSDLEIIHHLLPPASPERKPFVERFLQTLAEEFLRGLPGYVGPDVASRKRIRDRGVAMKRGGIGLPSDLDHAVSLDPAAFRAACNDWVHLYNTSRPHSSIGCAPAEKVREWSDEGGRVRGFEPHEAPEYARALQLLLAPVAKTQGKPPGVRVVRKGGVRVDGRVYTDPRLAGEYNGREVVCRYDETEMSHIVVCDLEGRFICIATDSEMAEGISLREAALAATHAQGQYIRKATREMKRRAKKVKPADFVGHLAMARRESTAVSPRPPNTDSSVPSIEEARQVARVVDAAQAAPELRDVNPPDVEDAIREYEAGGLTERPPFWDDAEHRYQWCSARLAEGDGDLLTAQDRDFVRRYKGGN